MEKYSLFRGIDGVGRPLIHRIEPGTRYGLGETSGLQKTASGEHLPEVLELVESIQPQPGRLYLVNSALGAGEYVGCNLRGDWFTEKGLNHTPEGWEDIPVWDIDARRQAANHTEHVAGWGNLAWGYPTFYNAHRFRHHVNQDPNRAYGYILGAFWDERMRRVILVSELIEEMCARLGALHIYNRIEEGEFPDTSMGAKVPYDVCLICGHTARTPAHYCEHVNDQDPRYGKRKILPDGRICGMRNDYPRFFDDSLVFVGAERSAKMMSNVTSRVRGQRAYTQKIYAFRPPVVKIATAYNAKKDQEEVLEKATAQALGPQPTATVEDRLARIIEGTPVGNPKERAALNYYVNKKRAEEAVAAGRLPSDKAELLELVERRALEKQGVDLAAYEKFRLVLEREFSHRKEAAHGKWAEILKRIPVPSDEQTSVIKSQINSMPSLPKPVLTQLSEDPGNTFRAAAQQGVVLKPHEFQYALLRGLHRDEAERFWDAGQVFKTTSIDLDRPSAYKASMPVPGHVLERVRDILRPYLEQRSFAPAAIRIRISGPAHQRANEHWDPTDNPLLDKVSSLYNTYRIGLLTDTPDWRRIPIRSAPMYNLLEAEKLAESAIQLPNLFLSLAYWPSFPLGW